MYTAEETVYVIGRGTIFIVDMKNYPNETIKLGDKITINDVTGIVTAIESAYYSTIIGVILKKENNNE